MRDVTAWFPDKAQHDACLGDARCDRVKELFGGVSPLQVNAWACMVASQLSEAEIDAAIRAGSRAAMQGYAKLMDQAPASPPGFGDLPARPQDLVDLPASPQGLELWFRPCPPSIRDLYGAVSGTGTEAPNSSSSSSFFSSS